MKTAIITASKEQLINLGIELLETGTRVTIERTNSQLSDLMPGYRVRTSTNRIHYYVPTSFLNIEEYETYRTN